MRMLRFQSFKCLLLFLVLVVVGLTVAFISKISSQQALSGFPPQARPRTVQDKISAFSYYQSVNEEEEEGENIGRENGQTNDFANKRRKIPQTGQQGIDYPFDEGGEDNNQVQYNQKGKKKKRLNGGDLVDITCNVNNGKYYLGCKKDLSEVYIPFSFLHKYFEVYGKLEEPKEGEDPTFTWLHSLAKIYRPSLPYNPKGIFTYFENYNVEVRDRVKCISGAEGVPVSTQWDVNGYFYPIQIAQFGLSHFSKFLTEGEPKRIILDDGDETRGGWFPAEFVNALPNDNNDPTANHYIQIQMQPSANSGDLSVKLDVTPNKPKMLMLSWHFRVVPEDLHPNVTLSASVRYESQIFQLHYVTADFLIQASDNNVYHGLGYKSTTSWQHVIRDLAVDLQKGINHMSQKVKKSKIQKISRSKLQLESVTIHCSSRTLILLDNLTLSSNEHLAQFYQAADWFVAHQDSKGGWPIPVKRKFGSEFYPVLEPGWYSAMGQGHALSLLARAYSASTNNSHYADACNKAIETIFERSGQEYGVRAMFLEKYTWYEEYPTTPSSFVLNGFMYALLGLYDVKAVGVTGASNKAAELYDEGLTSLKTMLPLYDTGSGTFYDLRHFTVPGISPNLARLDYHVTHINQLLMFATIEKDPIFKTIAERWISYTEGERAPHN